MNLPKYKLELLLPLGSKSSEVSVLLQSYCIPRMDPSGKGDPEVYLQGHTEDFSVHLVDNVIQIHPQLDAKHDRTPVEMPTEGTYPVNWGLINPIGIEEVGQCPLECKSHHLCVRSMAFLVSHPRWIQVKVNSFLI